MIKKTLTDEITKYRRLLHQHPQTAYEEEFISDFVAKKLKEWKIPYKRGYGKTGIVATINGEETYSKKAIGIRADMDALDILEADNKKWKSLTPGKMHGCGHDGHTSMLLGAAKYLKANPKFNGKVHLIFQPAEEGGRGAHAMVDDGLFKDFPCEQAFALHNWPGTPRGHFGTRPGPIMAASSRFDITIRGKGGHAAEPEKTRDPIVIASHIISALQTLVSRNTNPTRRAVISVTDFSAGSGAYNIIPDCAHLKGTLRNFKRDTRLQLVAQMEEMVTKIAEAMGASVDFNCEFILDTTVNDEESVHLCSEVAKTVSGITSVDTQFPGLMISEDFGEMLRHVRGAYVFIGQGEPDEPEHPSNYGLHNCNYDFNDKIIPIGVEYWAKLAEAALPL